MAAPQVARDEPGFVPTGSDLEGRAAWPLDRPPLHLETAVPSVLAAGDVRRGSVKRVAAAVGEGSVTIQLLHQLLAADGVRPLVRPSDPVPAS